MQLTCPNCASSYAVADAALGERGRQVRCAKCKHVWFAKPVETPVSAAAADADEPLSDAASRAEPPANDEISVAGAPPSLTEPAGADSAPPHFEDSPSITPDPVHEEAEPAAPAHSSKLDYFELRRRRAMRAIARKQRGLGITPGRLSAALLGILVALVFEREDIVRVLPQAASFYALAGFHINLRGIAFQNMKTEYEEQDGVRVLVVEGEMRNVTAGIRPVPRLRFALCNAGGAEIYSWTAVPERSTMAPGEVQPFKSRLASPPADGKDLQVRFFRARDMAAEPAAGIDAPSSPASSAGH